MISYWEQETFFDKQDIIIIGSGFVGLWSAITLAQQKKNAKITILDSGLIPTGASTKNAGFSCFGSPSELINDANQYGEDAMWSLVEKRYKGLEKIKTTFSPTAIDYDDCGGYECLQEKESILVLEKMDWLNNGLREITAQEKTFTFTNNKMAQLGLSNFHSLVENKLEGGIQPAKLLQLLYKKAISLGVQIFNNILLTHYEKKNEHIELYTNNSIPFRTTQLLFCTNAFTKHLLPQLDIVPGRGQVYITNEIDALKLKGCFHYDSGYYYFRNVGNRVLIGGARNLDFENEQTTTFDTTKKIENELVSFLQKHVLADIPFTITNAWSGIMAFGPEKKTIVQELETNIFCAVRMSGMGVALAPIVAEEITTLML